VAVLVKEMLIIKNIVGLSKCKRGEEEGEKEKSAKMHV
jgi:hypothetical protein